MQTSGFSRGTPFINFLSSAPTSFSACNLLLLVPCIQSIFLIHFVSFFFLSTDAAHLLFIQRRCRLLQRQTRIKSRWVLVFRNLVEFFSSSWHAPKLVGRMWCGSDGDLWFKNMVSNEAIRNIRITFLIGVLIDVGPLASVKSYLRPIWGGLLWAAAECWTFPSQQAPVPLVMHDVFLGVFLVQPGWTWRHVALFSINVV